MGSIVCGTQGAVNRTPDRAGQAVAGQAIGHRCGTIATWMSLSSEQV